MYKVLMVCLGNICRSPLAQGILETISKKNNFTIHVDSAGTGNWHSGSAPDKRSIEVAKKYGIDISQQKARQFSTEDFKKFHKIYAMDTQNYRDLMRLCSNEEDCNKVALILSTTNKEQRLSVPDRYYGGKDGFENIYKLLHSACEKIVVDLTK